MEENIFKYGAYDLDRLALIQNILRNLDSFLNYSDFDPEEKEGFINALSSIRDGISNGSISGDGLGRFNDTTGFLDDNNIHHKHALYYINKIALALSKVPVKKREEKEELESELEKFDFSKHSAAPYVYSKINMWGVPDYDFKTWRDATGDLSAINSKLVEYLDEHRKSISGKYDFSGLPVDELGYLNLINDLISDILTDGILNTDKLKLAALGFNYNNFIIPIDKVDNDEGNNEGGNDKGRNGGGNNTPELNSKLSIQDAVSKAWDLADTYDKVRMGTAVADFVSMVSSFVPTYGTAVSAATGLGSTAANTINDLADPNVGGWEALKNFGFNISMDVIGLIPWFGMTSKIKKLRSIIYPTAGIVGSMLGVAQMPDAQMSLNKLLNDPDNFTQNDLMQLMDGINAITGFTNFFGGVKANKSGKYTLDIDKVRIKDSKNKFQEITPEQYDELKKIKGLQNQNAKFKEWTGAELQREFKPAHRWRDAEGNFLSTGKRRFISSGPAIKKVTYQNILPKSDEEYWHSDWNLKALRKLAKVRRNFKKDGLQDTDSQLKQETDPKNKDPKEILTNQNIQEKDLEVPEVTSGGQETPNVLKEEKIEAGSGTVKKLDEEIKEHTTPEVVKPSKPTISNIEDLVQKLPKSAKHLNTPNAKKAKKVVDTYNKSNKILATDEFKEAIKELQYQGFTEKEAIELLTKYGYYLEGGILKSLYPYSEFSSVYNPGNINYNSAYWNTLYNENAISEGLAGANSSTRSNKLKIQGLDASPSSEIDLNLHWKKYRMYTNDNGEMLRTLDFINWAERTLADNSDITTLDLLLQKYNGLITDMYNYKRNLGTKYATNDETRTFNRTNRSMYSSQNDNGLHGYDENSENTNGITTMARSVDITDNDIDLDFSEGYLGEKKLSENLSKILGDPNILIVKSKTGHYYYKTSNVIPKKESKDNASLGSSATVLEIEKPIEKGESLEAFKPKFSYIPYLTSSYNYFNALRHNKKLLNLLNLLTPLLYDPKEDHRSVYGDLRSMMLGTNVAALLASRAAKPLTSDASLLLANLYEAFNKGLEYIYTGNKADDDMQRKTSEASWLQEKENHTNRYNVAMKNLENLFLIDREKLMAYMAKVRADYDSTTNYVNQLTTLATKEFDKRNKYDELAYKAHLSSDIKNHPWNYITGMDPNKNDAKLWRRYLAGENITDETELHRLRLLQEAVDQAYLSRIYGGYYYEIPMPNLSNFNKIEWVPNISEHKKGGKISKDVTDTIIKFLKESNNNYNKAIDRSIKGLYNHIKLLRKK